jgi:DNA-binding MarR family transcriptional regulator
VTGIDPLIHPPARLRLMATLSAVSEAEFATVRDRLHVSDSVLSKHISTLADAGYVKSRKDSHLGRRTTWVALTPLGSHALARHVAGLREVIADIDAPRPTRPSKR